MVGDLGERERMRTTTIIVFSTFVLATILGGIWGYGIGVEASENFKKRK